MGRALEGGHALAGEPEPPGELGLAQAGAEAANAKDGTGGDHRG